MKPRTRDGAVGQYDSALEHESLRPLRSAVRACTHEQDAGLRVRCARRTDRLASHPASAAGKDSMGGPGTTGLMKDAAATSPGIHFAMASAGVAGARGHATR